MPVDTEMALTIAASKALTAIRNDLAVSGLVIPDGHGELVGQIIEAIRPHVVPRPELPIRRSATLEFVPSDNPPEIRLPVDGVCRDCGVAIEKGSEALFHQGQGITHIECPPQAEAEVPNGN